VVGVLQVLADKTVVVDLTVGGNGNAVIGVGEGLSTGLNTDDRKTLMAENGVVASDAAAPIRTTVTDGLGKLQSRRLELGDIWVVVASEDSAHLDCCSE